MHLKSYLATFCVILLSGCIKFSSDKEDAVKGTTAAQAAEALTKAMSFAGGKLVEGLMPDSTTSDVSLIPDDAGEVTPGAASLMSFDITPDDTGVTGALVQFEGASDHFLIDSDAFVAMLDGGWANAGGDAGGDAGASSGAAADGGAGDGGVAASSAALVRASHASLMYTIEKNVCDDLCDTVYDLKVVEALQVGKQDVSKHQGATLKLDCTKDGDHAKCGASSETKGDAGDAVVKADPAAQKLITTYQAVYAALCSCNTADGAGPVSAEKCASIDGDASCIITAFSTHATEAKDQMACAQNFLDQQQTCVDAAACGPAGLQKCDIVSTSSDVAVAGMGSGTAGASGTAGDSGDAVTRACGAWPEALQAELDACDNTNTCSDGTPISPKSICDGAEDCKDGSDEKNCGVTTTDFACPDGVTILKQAQLCDGKDDCGDASDEGAGVCSTCPGEQVMYSFYMRCDGTANCRDKSDEVGCDFVCGSGAATDAAASTVSIKKVCDRTNDCADGSDEAACSGTAGEFSCGGTTYIPVEWLCDGTPQCQLTQADELHCAATTKQDAGVGGGSGSADASMPAAADTRCVTDADCPSGKGCNTATGFCN